MPDVIQSLWIGPRLSVMERLCVASYLAAGHPFHLYAYEAMENVPEGAEVKNGEEILPASMIFTYRKEKSVSAFSNFFRYKLLLEKGGWWVDTDTVCLKPFDFDAPYVIATEPWKRITPTTAVIKAPAGSPAMAHAWDVCQSKDRSALKWGEVGPRLMATLVKKFSLTSYLQPERVFCPFAFDSWHRALEEDASLPEIDETTRAVHFWNEMWRRDGRDKDGDYPPNCLYERLKRKFPRI